MQVLDLYNGDPEKPEFNREIDKSLSLDIDRKGDLYVLIGSSYKASERLFEIERYNLETSKFQGRWELPQFVQAKQPVNIAIDKSKDWLYVAYENGDIHKFTLDGVWVGVLGLDFTIINLAINKPGYLFAVCRDRIIKINPGSVIVKQWK